MARIFLKEDPEVGVVALFDEAPGGGDPFDKDAPMYAPLYDPINHLDKIYFHSNFNYMEVALLQTTTINHAGYAAASVPAFNGGGQTSSGPSGMSAGNSGFNSNSGFAVGSHQPSPHLLATHGLGYVPRYKIAVDNQMIPPGFPVQTNAGGAVRSVASYATTTEIRLKEFGNAGSSAMSAVSKNYQVMVFANPPAPSTNQLKWWDNANNVLHLGFGRWRSDRRYLQVVPGGSPFGLLMGRNVDLANGAARSITPDQTIVDSVNPDLRLYLMGRGAGTPMQYNGSLTSVPAILVQAP